MNNRLGSAKFPMGTRQGASLAQVGGGRTPALRRAFLGIWMDTAPWRSSRQDRGIWGSGSRS